MGFVAFVPEYVIWFISIEINYGSDAFTLEVLILDYFGLIPL